MKPEYKRDADARKNFEETMTTLFHAPKSPKPVKQPKKKAASKEKRTEAFVAPKTRNPSLSALPVQSIRSE